ncbi:unnamed protein product [Heterobilharzia americana]|nr:unnamed protein product [Heterobilharzia americana]
MQPRILNTMFVRLIPLWLSQEEFSPFLKTGIISDSNQSEGIIFDSHILANTSVNLTNSTLPPSLYTSAGSPSHPAALPLFKLPTTFSISASAGAYLIVPFKFQLDSGLRSGVWRPVKLLLEVFYPSFQSSPMRVNR